MSSKRAKTKRGEQLALVSKGTIEGKRYRMAGPHADIKESELKK